MDEHSKIYPELGAFNPTTPPCDGNAFRLQKCCEALDRLRGELKHYEGVLKKYNRSKGALINTSSVCGILSGFLAASGLASSLSGFGVVVAIPLGVVSGALVCASIGCDQVSKSFSEKATKHQRTVTVAKAKINTIEDLVSKALRDNTISDEEFSMIIEELKKFETMKGEVRQKDQKRPMKRYDSVMLKKQAREEILRELGGGAHSR